MTNSLKSQIHLVYTSIGKKKNLFILQEKLAIWMLCSFIENEIHAMAII